MRLLQFDRRRSSHCETKRTETKLLENFKMSLFLSVREKEKEKESFECIYSVQKKEEESFGCNEERYLLLFYC